MHTIGQLVHVFGELVHIFELVRIPVWKLVSRTSKQVSRHSGPLWQPGVYNDTNESLVTQVSSCYTACSPQNTELQESNSGSVTLRHTQLHSPYPDQESVFTDAKTSEPIVWGEAAERCVYSWFLEDLLSFLDLDCRFVRNTLSLYRKSLFHETCENEIGTHWVCAFLRFHKTVSCETPIQQPLEVTTIGHYHREISWTPTEPRRAETCKSLSERQISSESLAEGCAPRMVTVRSDVAPANQTEESQVRKLCWKESRISSRSPLLKGFCKVLASKRGFRNQFRTLSPGVRKPHFFGLVCSEKLRKAVWRA